MPVGSNSITHVVEYYIFINPTILVRLKEQTNKQANKQTNKHNFIFQDTAQPVWLYLGEFDLLCFATDNEEPIVIASATFRRWLSPVLRFLQQVCT